MKLAAISLGLAFAFLSATPAAAQWTGTRIGRDATAEDGMRAVEIIAECFVERHPAAARQWLETLPGTPEEIALVDPLVDDFGNCIGMEQQLILAGKEVAFKSISLRLPVARMLARRALSEARSTPAAASSAQPWFIQRLEDLPENAKVDRAALTLQDFGHCVAVKDWEASRALLLSDRGGADEQAALKRLIPSLGPCLTADVTLKLTPANLRDVLAEPVYHLISNPAASAAASGR